MDDGTPGDPIRIRELARHWAGQADAASAAATTLGSARDDVSGGELRLKGDFAPKIAETIGDLPDELRKLSNGYGGCSRALSTYATRLEDAQRKSGEAEGDLHDATTNRRSAESDLDLVAPGWDFWPRDHYGRIIVPETAADRSVEIHAAFGRRSKAEDDIALATSLSQQAAELRSEAEQDCVRDIKNALEDSGLKNKSIWQKIGGFLKETFTTWDGFVRLCQFVATVVGVIAIFVGGPLVFAILLVATIVVMADSIKKFKEGKIGWTELAFSLVGSVMNLFGGKAGAWAIQALRNTKTVTAFSSQMHKGANRLADVVRLGDRGRNVAHRTICTVTGHPIDVSTGKVFTSFVDLELPGPLPLTFERVWFSTSTYAGPLGHGWHHSYDAALYVAADAVLYRTPDGRAVDLAPLDPGDSYFDRLERLTVARDEAGYVLTDSDGLSYRFAPLPGGSDDDVVVHGLQDVTNRAGHRVALTYDDAGLLTEIVDSGSRPLRFEHNDQGRMIALTAPHPDRIGERFAVARYAYDDAGNLISMTDALDHVFQYAYGGHLLACETDRNGLSFYFEYDRDHERGRCVHTWGDGGIYDHHITYDIGITTVVNSLGYSTRYEHEGGLVVKTIDALGGETTRTFEYRQPVEQIDALGRITTYEYDHRGNQITVATPDGATVRATFDDRDLPVSAVDQVDGNWSWTYDEAGLLRERRDPLDRAWTFDYAKGLLASVTDPAGGVTLLDHDEEGSIVRITTPDSAHRGWRRNTLGWPIAAVDPLGNEQVRRFDLLGRAVHVDEPDGNIRDLSFDGEGNMLRATDVLYDVEFTYQGTGRLASRSQAGTTVRFDYDTEEQLTGVVNEHGFVYSFGYSPTGEVSVERGFDRSIRVYERDALGRVVSARRASGMTDQFEYDLADRVTAVLHADGTAERFAYRADGALISAVNATITVTFEPDKLGRILRETQGEHWIANDLDILGFRVGVNSSFGLEQVITRGPTGDVSRITANGWDARFTRNALGQELERELPGGVSSRWDRDDLGRPRGHELVSDNGMLIHGRYYYWELDDRLDRIADTFSGPVSYNYDAMGQLSTAIYSAGQIDLRMPDAVGNLYRTSDRSDRIYGAGGQLLEAVDEAGHRTYYSYDPEGNLQTKRLDNRSSWQYRWTADNLLAEVVRPDGSTVKFGYDALGRRVFKEHNFTRTCWVWDGYSVLHEWTEESLDVAQSSRVEGVLLGGTVKAQASAGTADLGAELVTWLFEPEFGAAVARITGSRADSVVADYLGVPVAITSAEGDAVWHGGISVWGEQTTLFGDGSALPIRWPGQSEDLETGLFYNRFRYYDPDSGDYISADPIGLLGGLRLRKYVHDPLTWCDPLGLVESCGSNAKILAENLVARGTIRPLDHHAHHIVASMSPKANVARQRLKELGIDINDARNGVFLPRNGDVLNPTGAAVHSTLHTDSYFRKVNEMIGRARTPQDATRVLSYVRRMLLAGKWPDS